MAEDPEWNRTVKEWLLDEGYCYAGAVASKDTVEFYGCAAVGCNDDENADAKWDYVYKKNRWEKLQVSDTEANDVEVDETAIVWEIADKGTKGQYPAGIWIAGHKHTLTRQQELDVEGRPVQVMFCARPKGGACIACTDQSIVIGFNDENKGQQGGNCQKAVLNFVGYLFGQEEEA